MQGQEVVLCLQETDLNFAEHEGCRGLGHPQEPERIGTLGLHMH